jgi:hypothetical protein
MSIKSKVKAKIAPVITGIITILPAIIGLFKKKKYNLWYRGVDNSKPPIKKGGPFSKRQCRKTQAELVALGTYLEDRFAILRDGVTP